MTFNYRFQPDRPEPAAEAGSLCICVPRTNKMGYLDNVTKEFQTVDLLLDSDTKTRRTDAFVISWIKVEKQVRKLFTYLIFQYPAFDRKHVQEIIKLISSKQNLYFENFIKGFDAIYPKSFANVVGAKYAEFMSDKKRIKKFRNKILHGQLTGEALSAEDLSIEVDIIREWCSTVAKKMRDEIHYDGFGRNSFRKCEKESLSWKYQVQINTVSELDKFIKSSMK